MLEAPPETEAIVAEAAAAEAAAAKKATTRGHPPGTIAVPAGEFLRFGGFVHSLATVNVPDGSAIQIMQSVSIPENLNHIIRNMVGDWLWCQADDHIFRQDALIRLLDRQADVVVPLMIRRSPPFSPLVYKDLTEDGYLPVPYEEIPPTGTFPVFAAGSGGMLIRRYVLERIADPWFEFEAGQRLNEDFVFCRKLRELDPPVEILCDPEVTMGHRSSYTIWPHHDEGGWSVALDFGAINGRRQDIVVHPHVVEREGENR